MDAVFDKVHAARALPDVDLFEVDVDEAPEISARFANRSIPYTRFYYRGQPIHLGGPRTIDGGLIGGLRQQDFVTLASIVHDAARAGRTGVQLA